MSGYLKPINMTPKAHEPIYFLLWRSDEFIPVFIALVIGAMTKMLLLNLLVAMAYVKIYRQCRENLAPGLVQHACWYYQVPLAFSDGLPDNVTRYYDS